MENSTNRVSRVRKGQYTIIEIKKERKGQGRSKIKKSGGNTMVKMLGAHLSGIWLRIGHEQSTILLSIIEYRFPINLKRTNHWILNQPHFNAYYNTYTMYMGCNLVTKAEILNGMETLRRGKPEETLMPEFSNTFRLETSMFQLRKNFCTFRDFIISRKLQSRY